MASVVSGEAVHLDLDRAGLGSRLVAAVIDLAVQAVALIGALILDVTLGGGDDAVTAALALVEAVGVLAVYPLLFEWLSRGRSLGKLAMGLRVVRDDGGPIGFRQALVRSLSGLLLEKPGLIFPVGTAIGAGLVAFTPASKRIGDFMAGTFVLRARAGAAHAIAPVPFWMPPELQPWAAGLDLSRVDDSLALSIRQLIQRSDAMSLLARQNLEAQLAGRLLSLISPLPERPIPAPTLLITVLTERRRRAELASQGASGFRAGHPPPSNQAPYRPPPYQSPPYQSQPYQSQPYEPQPDLSPPTNRNGPFTAPN